MSVSGRDLNHVLDVDLVATVRDAQIDSGHRSAVDIGDEYLGPAAEVVDRQAPGAVEQGGIRQRGQDVTTSIEDQEGTVTGRDQVAIAVQGRGRVSHEHKATSQDPESGVQTRNVGILEEDRL